MSSISLKKTVSFPLKHVVNIVCDVDNYALFLPWIELSKTHSREGNTFIGALTIAYKGMHYSYDSKVVVTEEDNHVQVKALALNGPFESMMTLWHIEKIDDQMSSITLSIKMVWKNPLFRMMFEALMDQASKQMMEAFEKRLSQIPVKS